MPFALSSFSPHILTYNTGRSGVAPPVVVEQAPSKKSFGIVGITQSTGNAIFG